MAAGFSSINALDNLSRRLLPATIDDPDRHIPRVSDSYQQKGAAGEGENTQTANRVVANTEAADNDQQIACHG